MKHKQNTAMSYVSGFTVAAVIGSLLLTSCLAQQHESANAAKARIADKILHALVEANGVPGMAAAVTRDGEVIWAGATGLRDVAQETPVDSDTFFRLASVSKLITVTAAAKLYEEDALDIDAPLQDFISYMPQHWSEITARQLAAHLSGIPHYQGVDANRGARRFDSIEDAVEVFASRNLLSEPGDAYHYSSYGYTLLSAAVEEAAGVSFLEYVESHISEDLAITPDALLFSAPYASQAYEFIDGEAVLAESHDYSYSWGGAGFSATASALAMFGARVLAGEIVNGETLDMMLTPMRYNDGNTVSDRDYEIGFGWRLSHDNDGALYAHHAGVAIGARSALAIVPGEKMSAAVLSNASWTASIEQTALTLALPFRTDMHSQSPCPIGAHQYDGHFVSDAISGSILFFLDGGICTGIISVDNAFGEWLNEFPQKNINSLKLISVMGDGGLSRAALITPIGAFDLRLNEEGAFSGRIGRRRMLTINLGLPP